MTSKLLKIQARILPERLELYLQIFNQKQRGGKYQHVFFPSVKDKNNSQALGLSHPKNTSCKTASDSSRFSSCFLINCTLSYLTALEDI